MSTQIEQNAISAIRVLSADMIQKANSGHPGLPLGAAPMAYTLWGKEMRPFRSLWWSWFRTLLFSFAPFWCGRSVY